MKADLITAFLLKQRGLVSMVFPNFTPAGWWECDVFELTKSGYFREYEIKTSRADFKNDKKKKGSHEETKYEALKRKSEHGPVEFWYVVPFGLISPKECPKWAGLIYIVEPSRFNPKHPLFGHKEVVVKKAPRLHGQKADASLSASVLRASYFRYLNAKQTILGLRYAASAPHTRR